MSTAVASNNNNKALATTTTGGSSSASSSASAPSNQCLQHCIKLAINDDKPIMLDYWTSSLEKKVLIGVRENGEKLLVKSEDEYTSPIEKVYKVENEYIIATENSLYITSSSIPTKRIS